jgi:hypothetical protein
MQSYQYSEPHSGSHVQFSPDGRLLASAVAYRLLLRDALTLQIVQVTQLELLLGDECSIGQANAVRIAMTCNAWSSLPAP